MSRSGPVANEAAAPLRGAIVDRTRRTAFALFGTWPNGLATVACLFLLALIVPPLLRWALIDAQWSGTGRALCDSHPEGACWTFVRVRFVQMMFGMFYGAHPGEIWRPLAALALLIALVAALMTDRVPAKWRIGAVAVPIYPVVAFALIHGGWLGLPVAETSQWGGFMLTLVIAVIGIVCALPIGILMALARRSSLPVIRSLAVAYIECWRGAPLITVLFMASVMLPLFFPSEIDFSKLSRAVVAITLFQSAYTAEAVRGGLQAIPRGQVEAATALGLGYWKTTAFVVLPQALRMSIPGIVNSFIELFKETSLISIIGMFDLLKMAETASRSPEWRGHDLEAYIFAGSIFWLCCYGMSRYSRRLENRLDTTGRATRCSEVGRILEVTSSDPCPS